MYSSLKRWLAVGSAAALTLVGFGPATTASAAMTDVATNQAANYVATHLPSKKATGGNLDSALALAATGQCTYAAPLRTLVGRLEDSAKSYIKNNPAGAAKLAIAVDAVGLNAKKFAKQNLVSAITKKLPKDGAISSYAFSQAIGIVALKRVGAAVPATMVTKLLAMQNSNGSFGTNLAVDDPVGDPDSTAIAIQALTAVGGQTAALDAAIAWAHSSQTNDGYWQAYSPVDSTGLLGSVPGLASADVTKAHEWLLTQQLKDGGFPNSLGGTSSNVKATTDALWLLSSTDLTSVSLKLSSCGSTPPKLVSATSSCTGVWVVVDRGNGQYTTRCATKYATGLDALKSAGLTVKTFTTSFGDSICQVAKFPSTCDTTFASGYWSYFESTQNADGTWGAWTYASTGPATSTPKVGVAEGHLWISSSIPWTADPQPTPSVTAPIGYAVTPAPLITGTAKVGQKLTVDKGTWSPTPPSLKVRWYRSGKAISGATKDTYKLTKSDAKKVITVKVTASGAGYQTVTVESKATAKVIK